MKDNFEIVHDFYDHIFADDAEKVKDLLVRNPWLQKFLQPSLLADMQFYDFDEHTRKYKLYFPSKELLDLLQSYGIDIKKSLNYPIIYSAEIQDNASYMSSSMQNKNAIKFEYDDYKNSYEKYEELNKECCINCDKYKKEHDRYQKYKNNRLSFIELARDKNRITDYESYTDDSKKDYNNEESAPLTPLESKRLSQMGNSWFVSYMYHFIDSKHNNWEKVGQGFRTTYFNDTKKAHKKYLEKISKSNEALLGKNQIGLPGDEIKKMAQKLLEKWDELETNSTYKLIRTLN